MGFPQIATVDWPSWDLAGLGKFKLTAGLFAWSIKPLLLEEAMGAGQNSWPNGGLLLAMANTSQAKVTF